MTKRMHKAAAPREALLDAVAPVGRTPPSGAMLSGHYHCRVGYRVLRPQGAGSWLLLYTVAGSGLFRQPGRELLVKQGDLVLLAPEAYSDYGVPPEGKSRAWKQPVVRLHRGERPRKNERCGWQFHYVHFQPLPDWAAWLDWRTDESSFADKLQHMSLSNEAAQERIAAAFARMHGDLQSPPPWGEALAAASLQEVLLTVAQRVDRARQRTDARVAATLRIMREDLAGEHTVQSLAKAVNLSPSRFAHLFRDTVGDSVVQTLIRLRLEQSKRMLALADARIGEISKELGFSSQYYFSRLFQKHVGQSPKSFRESARK